MRHRFVSSSLQAVRKFHEDEQGIEAIQVVMILGIAAVAAILIKSRWPGVREFFRRNADQLLNWSPSEV